MINLTFCIDAKNGLSFNDRRLSKDKKVAEYILRSATQNEKSIYATEYSKSFFNKSHSVVFIENLENVTSGIVFAEKNMSKELVQNADSITIFNWNRLYPCDVLFDESLLSEFTLRETADFTGNSHETITIKKYIRRK